MPQDALSVSTSPAAPVGPKTTQTSAPAVEAGQPSPEAKEKAAVAATTAAQPLKLGEGEMPVPATAAPAEASPGGSVIFVALRALGLSPQQKSETIQIVSSSEERATPPPKKPGFFRRHGLFFLCVLLPTALAAAYFGLYASNLFISEARYVVRSPNQKGSSSGGMGAMLQGAGFSGFAKVPDEVMAVSEYITSRDALNLLQDSLKLRETWGASTVDFFQRFDPFHWNNSLESLYEYYPHRVRVNVQPTSGITTLITSSFDPQQAYEMNALLLGEAERLVNLINDRGRRDLILFAESEVRRAEEKAKEAAVAVSDFRNREGVVNPEQQTQLHFQHISRLQEELMKTRAQLAQLKVFAPESPHPPPLELRVQTLESEIRLEMEKITGGEKSLASKAAEYERLALDRQFADNQLSGALASLEIARSEAQRQQLYLETIAKPSQPDEAIFPKRIRGVVTTLVIGLVAWGIMSMLVAGVREHKY